MSNLDAWNTVPTLRGQHVTLQPLQMEHVPGLRDALEGSGLDQLWYTQVPDAKAMTGYVQAALQAQAEGKVLPFVVFDANDQIVGTIASAAADQSGGLREVNTSIFNDFS